jgi:hypothetical protein
MRTMRQPSALGLMRCMAGQLPPIRFSVDRDFWLLMGSFRKEDESGITSFGESSKTTDSAAIGKFGFGQKAVFHLCDAFVVYAQRRSGEPFGTVVPGAPGPCLP